MKHTWHIPIKIIKSQFFHPKSHQYYHSSQNTRHLNRKKIFIHLLFFIRYNSKLSISCHGKKYTYIKKEKRRKYSHRIKIAQTNVVTSRVKRSIDISKSLTITRQIEREREKNSDMEANDLNYIDRSADSCITSVVGRHTPLR